MPSSMLTNILSRALVATALLGLRAPIATALPAQGQKMMAAGPSPYVAEITREVASRGGNVVDAAVAIGLGLSVTSPYYASLGGGGFAMIKMGTNPVEVLDFRETAPKNAGADLYKSKSANASINGGLAVAVPGVPAGLWALHKKHGKLQWRSLFRIPIRLAQDGFLVGTEWAAITKRELQNFNQPGKDVFAKKNGVLNLPGDRLRQPRLAKLLKLFADQGPKAFYEGRAAKDIVAAVHESGGIMTEDDLKAYQVRWLQPMTTTYLGHTIYLMPPPSSGGVVISTALKLMEKTDLKSRAPLSVAELHTLGSVLKLAFRSRTALGDPDFVQNPIDTLLSDETLNGLSKKLHPSKVPEIEPWPESTETTHFSLLDSQGNAVALTVTLNGNYGSGVVTPTFGIALNNEMDDFTTRPGEPNMFGLVQGKANAIAPGKRPLSSMSPTLVEKDGRILMSLGSPGGPRIISSVIQVLHRTLANEMDMDQAIQAPRLHHQFMPDKLFVDPLRISPDVLESLRKMGHVIVETPVAKVYGVRRNKDGLIEAAFDTRGDGGAGGL